MQYLRTVWVCLTVFACHGFVFADRGPVPAFFEQHCFKCHDERKHKGDLRLDLLKLPITAKNEEIWKEVVHNLQRGDMPPEKEKQPKSESKKRSGG
jgi:hypothetical protein